jgi:GDPmannose 4,6-dehydratase
MSAKSLGIELEFNGSGLDEVGIVKSIEGDSAPAINIGDVLVKVNPRYFRPAEVETLLGDPSKAKESLGWSPEITVEDLCSEMITHDLNEAKKKSLLKSHGYKVSITRES